jgi:hypothetical protein
VVFERKKKVFDVYFVLNENSQGVVAVRCDFPVTCRRRKLREKLRKMGIEGKILRVRRKKEWDNVRVPPPGVTHIVEA